MFFFPKLPRERNLVTDYRQRVKCTVYFLQHEYNRTTFLYVSERGGWFYLRKLFLKKRRKNTGWNPIYISVCHQLFEKNLRESPEICLRAEERVSVCTVVMFFCFQLASKSFSPPIFTAVPVSSTSFLGLCRLGKDKGANSSRNTALCVWRCECLNGHTVRVCVWCAGGQTACFHTRSVDSFTHHCGEHTHTHTGANTHLGAVGCDVGIKGELHRGRPERLLLITCNNQLIVRLTRLLQMWCRGREGDLTVNVIWLYVRY